MPATARKVTRTSRPPERSAPRARGFRQMLVEFLSNKAMIETLTARNQGEGRGEDKKPGLRDFLLGYVMKQGERDPETGSYILDLDEPVTQEITGSVIKRLKAERRAPKHLDTEAALELADKLGIRDKVEEFQYVLRLTAEQAEQFAALLKKAGLVDRVQSSDTVVVEDNLLQIHYGRDPHTAAPLMKTGKGGKQVPLLSAEQIDALYVEDETWAFKPLTR